MQGFTVLEKTRFRLKSFGEKVSAEQREKLDSLIADTRGPLRVHSKIVGGQKVLYLRIRTFGQYFEEMFFKHILDMPEKVIEREKKTTAAIKEHIEPHLKIQPSCNNATPDKKHAQELMDKLYKRVSCRKISADYFKRKQACEFPLPLVDCDNREFLAYKSIRPSGCIYVNEGLSVARIASDKINADVHIRANQSRARTGLPEAGIKDDSSMEHVDKEARLKSRSHQASRIPSREPQNDQDNTGPDEQNRLELPDEKDGSSEDLIKHYWLLLKNSGINKKTVVMEVASNHESHWVAAYAAAASYIKFKAEKKISIMLVPHYLENEESNNDESLLSDAEWLKKRAQQLGLHEKSQKPSHQSEPKNLGQHGRKTREHAVEEYKLCKKEIKTQKSRTPLLESVNLEFSDSENESNGDTDSSGSPSNHPRIYESLNLLLESDDDEYSIVI
jgi:hypothetical protein